MNDRRRAASFVAMVLGAESGSGVAVRITRASVDDYFSAEEDFEPGRANTPPGSDFDIASSAAEEEGAEEVKLSAADRASVVERVKEQLEFYFSDSSMRKDHWLRSKAREHPELYIQLGFLVAFKRIRNITKDVSIIAEAADLTDIVTLNTDRTAVRRTVKLQPDPLSLAWRSVVLQDLPEGATVQSLRLLCEPLGAVQEVWIFEPVSGATAPEALVPRLAELKAETCAVSTALRPTGSTVAIVALEEERDKWSAVKHLDGQQGMRASLLVTSLKEKKRKAPVRRLRSDAPDADSSGMDSDGGDRWLSRSPRGEPPDGYVCRNCNIPGHFLQDCKAPRYEVPPPEYICHRCKIPGHWVQECPNPPASSARSIAPPDGYICHKCNKPGHWIQNCPLVQAEEVVKGGLSSSEPRRGERSLSRSPRSATPPVGYSCHKCGSSAHYIHDCPKSTPRSSPRGSPAASPRTSRRAEAKPSRAAAARGESPNWRAKSASATVGFAPRSPSPARRLPAAGVAEPAGPLGVTRSPLGPGGSSGGFAGKGRGRG